MCLKLKGLRFAIACWMLFFITFTYVCMQNHKAHVHAHVHVRMCVCACACARVYAHVRVWVCACACECVSVRVCARFVHKSMCLSVCASKHNRTVHNSTLYTAMHLRARADA